MWLLREKSKLKGELMKNKTQIIKTCALALIPASFATTMAGISAVQTAYADTTKSYVKSYQESVTISNASFTTASKPYSSGNEFTGWSAIERESKATGMIIDTTDDETSSSAFSKYRETYNLVSNPGQMGNDTRVLMINSSTKNGATQEAYKGYRSNSISLQANSYYKFSVAVKTALNQEAQVNASVYISGLKDKSGEEISLGYEGLNNSSWKEHYFFIATGSQAQTITIDLYLGSANGMRSNGAVFFDDIQGYRFSQNEFYDEIVREGYTGNDDYKTYHSSFENPVFLASDLLEERPFVSGLEDYNFDFENTIEDNTNTLGDEFSVAGKENGHALIQDILNMQSSDFKKLTGYDYVGTDLSKDNSQALILFTGKKENGEMTNAKGYVGVESKEIEIKAHTIYKISLKAKVSKIEEGSFYLKVQENDNIIYNYSDLLSEEENEVGKEVYSLKSGKSTAITSNVTNNFENDYQTVTFFVKGHSLFSSSINLGLWLGDEESQAKGCVVVDNITVEYATYSDYEGASNKLELTSTLASDKGITNGEFDKSENEKAEENFLVKASSWTVSKENDKNESGIVYLYNAETFKEMYPSSKYSWSGIYPGKMTSSAVEYPNNVYLMSNQTASYQSITSSSFTLQTSSGASYHKLAFSLYSQDGNDLNNVSKIKVEVIDENGIVLFSKNDIRSLNKWSEFEVYFHTHANISHTAQVKVSLGEEDDKVCGAVYLDNFSFESSADFETAYTSSTNKVDLSLLGLDEETTNELQLSNFYAFSDGTTTFTQPRNETGSAGIINGRENAYNEFNEDLKIEDNYLVLSTAQVGSVKLTSKYKFKFEDNKYYKLSFDLATIFNESALNAKTDEHDCKYGVSVIVDGYEEISGLLSADKLKSYEIFFSSASSTPTLQIKLVSDCADTLGTALITRLDFASVEENVYNNAKVSSDLDDKVYIAKTAEEQPEEPDKDDDNNDDSQTSTDNAWILIPSIITGLAVIVGVVGYAMRHVKLKKIDKIKKAAYDRKLSVNHDAIMVEAQKRRDGELEVLNKAKASLLEERTALEQEHKEFIKSAREKDGEKISREVEKAFKTYNANLHKINQKIDIIKEKIDHTISAEYLLTIERKILAEQDEKASKAKKNK